MGPRTLPKHARPSAVGRGQAELLRHARPLATGRWTGRVAERVLTLPPPDAEAARPDARRDPLLDPLAVTEHCFIGDQIRLPAARCDILGCDAEFADLAALGEADNRARALAAGWRVDAFGRLMCPACQQHHSVPRPRTPRPGPDTGGGPTPAALPQGPRDARRPPVPPGPRDASRPPFPQGPRDASRPPVPPRQPDGGSSSIRARITEWHDAVSTGRHRVARWPHMLAALVSGTNGWNAPQPVTDPPPGREHPAGPQARSRPTFS